MSGVLETAAGAFAVIGVVDVLIRSGRELHTFLHDMNDAPSNLTALSDSIRDTVALADTSKGCLQRLIDSPQSTSSADVAALFQKAVKSLELELKRLKTLLARYKGASKRWASIKYVLDEGKITKAVSNIEYSKLLLSNALIFATRYVAHFFKKASQVPCSLLKGANRM
jgi:hypothetical protein